MLTVFFVMMGAVLAVLLVIPFFVIIVVKPVLSVILVPVKFVVITLGFVTPFVTFFFSELCALVSLFGLNVRKLF